MSSPLSSVVTTVAGDRGDRQRLVRGARLVVVAGPALGSEVVLGESRTTVGRAPGASLVVSDPQMSAIHLEVTTGDEGYWLRDLKSTNGTFLGPCRVHEALLGPDAEIRAGATVLRFGLLDQPLAVPMSPEGRFGALLGDSGVMRRLFALLARVAPSDLTVLVEGESGTGKEEVARALHARSARASGPFVVLDCGALPGGLAEATLFGHERGAFTGADRTRPGAFEAAHGGTIFLDEIGELGPALQPKLLRVLESRRVVRLGDHAPRPFDARVVAATNRDLRQMVNAGQFREDLYYRLAELHVRIPTLRERPRDVGPLCDEFLMRASIRSGTRPTRLTPEAHARLARHPWPGNARELRNLMHRLAALVPGRDVSEETIARELRGSTGAPALPIRIDRPFKEAKAEAIQQFEALYLSELMDQFQGNVSHAAKHAELARHNLRILLRKAGLAGEP